MRCTTFPSAIFIQKWAELCHNTDVKYLTLKEVKDLFPNASEREYPAGQIIVYQGDEPSHVFYVTEGAIKYYDIDQNGNEKILHVVGENGFFPMFYALGTYTEIQAFYSSLGPVKLLMIPMDDFKSRVASDAQLSNLILQWFVHEAQYMIARIKSLEKSEARIKVSEALLYLAARHAKQKRKGWYSIKFPLSQQFLADLTGLSRETVSMALKDIDSTKAVCYPKQLSVEVHKDRLERSLQS